MRCDDIRQLAGREVLGHPHEQFIEGEVASGIDDCARVVIDDQELVGLNRLPILLDEVGKHEAGVMLVAIEFQGHVDAAMQ